MGDIIHTLPAAAALRQAFPHATLGWLVEERWAELLCTLRYPRSGRRSPQRPLVDRVHSVNTAEWRRAPFSFNTWLQMGAGLSELRGIQYDAAIDFQGAVRSALLARWSGAPIVYGSAQPRENAASMFYTRKVLSKTNGTHVVEQALALAGAVIADGRAFRQPLAEAQVEFPVDPDAESKIAGLTADVKELRDSQSRRGLGGKEVAGRALRTGCEGTRKRWIMFARKLRAGRRRAGRGRGSRWRRGGAKNLLLGF